MMPRILIITTKQPSTNPRMRKAADALAAAGHDVHALYAYNTDWATEADASILSQAPWSHERIGGHPSEDKWTYFKCRLQRKWHEKSGQLIPSFCRGYRDYIRKGLIITPDLVIGHNPGSLGVITELSNRLSVPAIFDAEDYHRGEFPEESQESQRVAKLEGICLPKVHGITAASPLIAEAYQSLFPAVPIETVNNAFPQHLQTEFQSDVTGPLRLVWFSQVVGLDRGLGDFLKCLDHLDDVPVEVRILGTASEEVQGQLTFSVRSANHQLSFHPPRSENTLFQFIGSAEIGLALEPGFSINNDLARSNKIYTYPLAGCYTLATGTAAQAQFFDEYPRAGEIIDSNKPRATAERLREIYENRKELEVKRKAAWALGQEKLNWECESRVLIQFINKWLPQ
jgi:glycosyltransferase involved in cell wall biosynthesis